MATDKRSGDVPPKDASPEQIKRFIDAFASFDSSYQIEIFGEMYEAKAFIESHQWNQRQRLSNGRLSPRIVDQQHESIDQIPKPVHQIILPIYDSERGKLANRKSKPRLEVPKVLSKKDARDEENTKSADDILESHLDTIKWDRERRAHIDRFVGFGTAILKSYLQSDWLDIVQVGKTGVWKCLSQTCGSMLASKEVSVTDVLKLPPDKVGMLRQSTTYNDKMDANTRYTATHCLDCGAPMGQHDASVEEGQGTDMFGKSLGVKVPKNQPMITSLSPFTVFFENEGIGRTPQNCKQFAEVRIENLDDVAQMYGLTVKDGRYYKGDVEVKAEDPEIIAEHSMILGEFDSASTGSANLGSRNLYKNHVRLREFYALPSLKHPRGRAIVMAGNVIVLNDDFMLASKLDEGVFIPRVKYGIARYYTKENELRGQGLTKPLIGLQKIVNMRFSQITSTAERNGNEGIMVTRGMRVSSPGMIRGYPGHIVVYEPDPEAPNVEPKPFPARLMNAEVYTEIGVHKEQAKEIAGFRDLASGKVDVGKQWAASAIKEVKEADAERREQRTEELISSYTDVWEHQLMLLREFVRPGEWRPFSRINKSTGKREEDQFTGTDIPPTTKLRVEEEPDFDETAYERDGIVQGINLGVILPDTEYRKYEIAKALGLPASITEQSSIQINDATRKWYAFKEEGEIPAIDEHQDDHYLFFTTYGKELKGEWAIEQKILNHEYEMLRATAGWEQKLYEVEAIYAQAKALQGALAQTGQQLPPEMQEVLQLPNPLEEKIGYVWNKMVEKKQQDLMAMIPNMAVGISTMPLAPPMPPFDLKAPWFKFKAVTEAHRLYHERKSQAAQMAPQAAAPGGMGTITGNQAMPGEQAGMVQ